MKQNMLTSKTVIDMGYEAESRIMLQVSPQVWNKILTDVWEPTYNSVDTLIRMHAEDTIKEELK
jgi:hypothetical protein